MPEFKIPEHVFYGTGALSEAGHLIKGFGGKALIVTGRHVVKSPMMADLKKVLDSSEIPYALYSGIVGEPTLSMIEGGYEVFRKEKCTFCIGIGGGSPMDSAKAVAAMTLARESLTEFNGREICGEAPPVVAIPTTAGTGSEATRFFCVTDESNHLKMLLKGDCLIPEVAVIDPTYSSDMPKRVTAATGLDALTHAIEAYISRKAFPLTDTCAVSAIRRILKYLPVSYRNGYDQEAREQMAIAAFEAGVCICNSSVTIVHGMSRPIGALFHVSHGISNAMILVPCLRFVSSGSLDRFADLGRLTGFSENCDSDAAAAEKFLNAVGSCCRACEVPTLREYGIDPKEFRSVIPKMSEDAIASGSPGNSIRAVTAEDCAKLYENLIRM